MIALKPILNVFLSGVSASVPIAGAGYLYATRNSFGDLLEELKSTISGEIEEEVEKVSKPEVKVPEDPVAPDSLDTSTEDDEQQTIVIIDDSETNNKEKLINKLDEIIKKFEDCLQSDVFELDSCYKEEKDDDSIQISNSQPSVDDAQNKEEEKLKTIKEETNKDLDEVSTFLTKQKDLLDSSESDHKEKTAKFDSAINSVTALKEKLESDAEPSTKENLKTIFETEGKDVLEKLKEVKNILSSSTDHEIKDDNLPPPPKDEAKSLEDYLKEMAEVENKFKECFAKDINNFSDCFNGTTGSSEEQKQKALTEIKQKEIESWKKRSEFLKTKKSELTDANEQKTLQEAIDAAEKYKDKLETENVSSAQDLKTIFESKEGEESRAKLKEAKEILEKHSGDTSQSNDEDRNTKILNNLKLMISELKSNNDKLTEEDKKLATETITSLNLLKNKLEKQPQITVPLT